MNQQLFFTELSNNLASSNSSERNKWAQFILDNGVQLEHLVGLLEKDQKVVSRFMWLLSELALINPEKVKAFLPIVLKKLDNIHYSGIEATIANHWLICGVPEEILTEAIDLLFNWVQSANVNITTKSRSVKVLFELTKKYPELKNELKLCLENDTKKNNSDSIKLYNKILVRL